MTALLSLIEFGAFAHGPKRMAFAVNFRSRRKAQKGGVRVLVSVGEWRVQGPLPGNTSVIQQ